MKYALPVLCRGLHTIALALWMGGLIAIGALVAPTAFHLVRNSPALTGQAAAQTALAGGIVGDSLRLFNILCYVCGSLMVVTDTLLLAVENTGRTGQRLTFVSLLTALILLGLALYLGLGLFPALDKAQGQNNMARFDQLHHRYESLSSVQLLPLLLIGLLIAVRDSLPRPSDPITKDTPGEKHLAPGNEHLLPQ